jgi:hypothetical protein
MDEPREGAPVKFSVQTAVLPELTAEQVVEKLSRHGYDGVEWRLHEAPGADRRGLRGHGMSALPDGPAAHVRFDGEPATRRA